MVQGSNKRYRYFHAEVAKTTPYISYSTNTARCGPLFVCH